MLEAILLTEAIDYSSVIHDSILAMYGDALNRTPKGTWGRELREENKKHRAWVYVVKDKKSFAKETAVRTVWTLNRLANDYTTNIQQKKNEAPFITFNSFCSQDNRSVETLRWINAISIELDNPNASVADVHFFCDEYGLPYPSLIVKSPNGLHLHWLLEQRTRAYKTRIKTYQTISEAFKKVFARIGADAIGPERYWRMPTTWNVLVENFDRYTLAELNKWAESAFGKKETIKGRVVKNTWKQLSEDAAIQEVLKGAPCGIRNKACFTIGLLMAGTGEFSQTDIQGYLSTWNQQNDKKLRVNEVNSCAKSAYKRVSTGRGKGASEWAINDILEYKGSSLRFRYLVRSKYEGQTTYTKRSDLANRILEFVRENGGEVTLSQRVLAEQVGHALKSVQLAIKEIKELNLALVDTIKAGRYGSTTIKLFETVQQPTEDVKKESKVIPFPSNDPIQRLKSTVAALTEPVTIAELEERSKLEHSVLMNTLLELLRKNELVVGDPGRDGRASFILPP